MRALRSMRSERGGVLVLMALMFPLMLSLAALVMVVGLAY